MKPSIKQSLNDAECGNKSKPLLVAGVTLEDGEYYKINGTKKILYWDGNEWMKPEKNTQKRYGVWNSRLEKQPTNIKSIEPVDIFACH